MGTELRSADQSGETALLAKVDAMPAAYRPLGRRLHALILRCAPSLRPALWYGMPAYTKDGVRICFFRADKYLTFGLTPEANLALEPGAPHQLRPCAWYLSDLDEATEAELGALVRKAAG